MTGLAIKDFSPLDATFKIELANGYNGYLPTPKQQQWGGCGLRYHVRWSRSISLAGTDVTRRWTEAADLA